MIVLLQALGIITCIIIVGMFSGMETGVISINRMRLRHSQKQGSRAADILTGFLANTDRLLGTTLVGTNLFTVMATVLAVNAATHWFCNWGEPVATACMALLLLVFGEYLPKSWFYSKLGHGRPHLKTDHVGRDTKFRQGLFDQPGALVDMPLIRS